MPPGFQDYTPQEKGKPSLYSMLSLNNAYLRDDAGFALNQAFREAGKLFQVFDDSTQDVLVPHRDGRQVIADLCSEQASRDAGFLQDCLERAKPYAVSLFSYQRDRLKDQGGLYAVCGGKVLVLQSKFYDEHTGLRLEAGQNQFLEVSKL
jgi:CRISPR-associated endonuclease/helicase Cas3